MSTQPTVSQVIRAVSRHYGISPIAIRSASRTAELVEPRHVSAYLARHLTFASSTAIGVALGGKDHSTALHAVGRVAERRMHDHAFRAMVDDLALEIRAEAEVYRRLGLALPPDLDPVGLAEQIMTGQRDPVRLSLVETLALAAAVCGQNEHLGNFNMLIDRSEEALAAHRLKGRSNDARSLERFSIAMHALREALRSLPESTASQPAKEAVYG